MSVGSDTKLEEALALVDRMQVWDRLVLSGARPCAAASVSCQSQHAGDLSHCSGTGALPSEATNLRADALHQRRLCVESP